MTARGQGVCVKRLQGGHAKANGFVNMASWRDEVLTPLSYLLDYHCEIFLVWWWRGEEMFNIRRVTLTICSTKVTNAFLLHPLRGNKKSSYLTEDGYLMETDKRFVNIPRGILKKNVKREPEIEVQEVCVEMKEEAATGTNYLTFFLLFCSKIAFYDEKMYSGKNGLQPTLMTLWTQNI